MRIVVLSRNRAAQAELLLRSIKEQVSGWEQLLITVFYRADSDAFDDGYSLLRALHPEFHFAREAAGRSVNDQIRDLLAIERRKFFAFFVDDLVVIRPFRITDPQFGLLSENRHGDILALSLRLNPRISWCQPLQQPTRPCRIDAQGTFCYRKSRLGRWFERAMTAGPWRGRAGRFGAPIAGDWKYQMVVDGNVYRFDEFVAYFSSLDGISSVPRIEDVMLRHPLPGRRIVIYPHSRVINIASNRVRTDDFFSCEEEDPAAINARFLARGRLDYEGLKNMANTSCHLAMRLPFQQ